MDQPQRLDPDTEESVRQVRRLVSEMEAMSAPVETPDGQRVAYDMPRFVELVATLSGLALELAQETRHLRTVLVNEGLAEPYPDA
jgi:hypothetical protein